MSSSACESEWIRRDLDEKPASWLGFTFLNAQLLRALIYCLFSSFYMKYLQEKRAVLFLNNSKREKTVEAFWDSFRRQISSGSLCLSVSCSNKAKPPCMKAAVENWFHSLGARFYQHHQCWTCKKLLTKLWCYTSLCGWMLLSNIWSRASASQM